MGNHPNPVAVDSTANEGVLHELGDGDPPVDSAEGTRLMK
jgi:hypothetical protein